MYEELLELVFRSASDETEDEDRGVTERSDHGRCHDRSHVPCYRTAAAPPRSRAP